ncbi:MAG TPA: M56 family metallopeptidase [Clostridiales bacterium]|nr:M56 family metallopeptidase [Clostridiales bacterium]
MTELLITSSILIIIVAALRFALKNKLSRRIRYALWGVVVLRLMLPFSLFESPISAVDSDTVSAVHSVAQTTQIAVLPYESYTLEEYAEGNSIPLEQAQAEVGASELEAASVKRQTIPLETLLKWIWFGGAAVAAVWFFIRNTVFYIKLLTVRVPVETECKLKVYQADFLHSPCLFGLLKPAVYLNEKALADENTTKTVLTHELCHYTHADNLWSFVRCALLAVYWFDPFVWMAAAMSRTDCESACDEAAVKKLGEENRIAYGKTLIGMIEVKKTPVGLTCAATTMVSGKNGIKERVKMIVKNHKTRAWAAVVMALIMVLTIGCTFGTTPPEGGIVTNEDMKLGELKIGLTMNEVKSILGEPTRTGEYNMDDLAEPYEAIRPYHFGDCYQWRYDKELILSFYRFEEGDDDEYQLGGIALGNDKYTLPNGLKVGSKLIEVVEAYSWDESYGVIISDFKSPDIRKDDYEQSAYYLYGGVWPDESDEVRTEAVGTAYINQYQINSGTNCYMINYDWCPKGSFGWNGCYILRFDTDVRQEINMIVISYIPTIYLD